MRRTAKAVSLRLFRIVRGSARRRMFCVKRASSSIVANNLTLAGIYGQLGTGLAG